MRALPSLLYWSESFVAELGRCLGTKVKPDIIFQFVISICDDVLACIVCRHQTQSSGFNPAEKRTSLQYRHRILNIREMKQIVRPPTPGGPQPIRLLQVGQKPGNSSGVRFLFASHTSCNCLASDSTEETFREVALCEL